jgi:hypothetical protein
VRQIEVRAFGKVRDRVIHVLGAAQPLTSAAISACQPTLWR